MVSSANQAPLLVLASTFYTPALEKPFSNALARRGLPRPQVCVPYNQLHGFLLNPGSLIPNDTPAQIVLLLRVEDVVRPELSKPNGAGVDGIRKTFEARVNQLGELLARSQLKLTVLICPSGYGCYDLSPLGPAVRVSEHKIAAGLRLRQRHRVTDWFDWPEFYRGAKAGGWFNVAGDRLGHVPFTPPAMDAIAEYFVEQLDRMPVTLIREHRDTCDGLELARFLAGLGVEVAIERMSSSDEQTVVDLVRHTTHFINVLDRKWDRKLLSEFAAEGEAWTVRVRDRFGDYGISGAVTFAIEADVMRIGLLFLTCPVLGKQVEHALFAWIAQTAAERGARVIDIEFVRGRDNEGLCTLLSSLEENAGADLAQGMQKKFRLPVAGMEVRTISKAVNPEAVSQILGQWAQGAQHESIYSKRDRRQDSPIHTRALSGARRHGPRQ
jgi:hypothetical protein